MIELPAAAARDPQLANVAIYGGALPTDMLLDILLRLPADVVCRMRLVCRTWRLLTSDPPFAREHASRHPTAHVIVVRHHVGDDRKYEASEVRAVDLHGNLIKGMRIQRHIGRLSLHGDLVCATHGWTLTSVVDMVTGAVTDVAPKHWKEVNTARPHCVLGHVRATGEYKVLRIHVDYVSRQGPQACEVVTLGGGGGNAGRWRQTPCPPVTLRVRPWSRSWNVAVVAGLVYFLVDELSMEADSIAVFDLATEEWKPATLQGPLTSSILASTVDKELMLIRPYLAVLDLDWKHFQLARLGERLVVVYWNIKNGSTELWFLEDMKDDTTARWSKRYTLERTPFGIADSPQYHYPLAVLNDGRILVWVNWTSALRAYDPETCSWTDWPSLQEILLLACTMEAFSAQMLVRSGLELV